jgi:hypothetical protein
MNFLLGFCLALGYVNSALADTFTLKFENIVSPPDVIAPVGDYYNGTGGAANNFGVTFSSNALAVCLSTPGVLCTNTSRGGLGDPTSQGGGLTFVDGNDLVLNYGAGFINSLDFFYASVNFGGSISIFSDVDGGGSLLATMNLSTTPWPCGAPYDSDFCPFASTSLPFSGTAKSAVFTTTNDDPDPDLGPPQMVLDDISLTQAGAETNPGGPSAVPEPSSLVLLVTGAATAGAGLRRRMKAVRN